MLNQEKCKETNQEGWSQCVCLPINMLYRMAHLRIILQLERRARAQKMSTLKLCHSLYLDNREKRHTRKMMMIITLPQTQTKIYVKQMISLPRIRMMTAILWMVYQWRSMVSYSSCVVLVGIFSTCLILNSLLPFLAISLIGLYRKFVHLF